MLPPLLRHGKVFPAVAEGGGVRKDLKNDSESAYFSVKFFGLSRLIILAGAGVFGFLSFKQSKCPFLFWPTFLRSFYCSRLLSPELLFQVSSPHPLKFPLRLFVPLLS